MSRQLRLSVLALSAILVLPVLGAAQPKLLARVGASIVTLGGDDAGDTRSRTGFSVGGALVFDVTSALRLQAGASYVQKGASVSAQGFETTYLIDYVEVPVLIQWDLPAGRAFSPHLVAGPAVSVELGCDVKFLLQGLGATVSCRDGGVPPRTLDVGVVGGVGVDIATAGSLFVTLDVLYNLGLRSIDDTGRSDVKNRAWSILGGVAIPVG